jgi:hypothetical protein
MVLLIPPKDRAEVEVKMTPLDGGYDMEIVHRSIIRLPEKEALLNFVHALAKMVGIKNGIRYLELAEQHQSQPVGWKEDIVDVEGVPFGWNVKVPVRVEKPMEKEHAVLNFLHCLAKHVGLELSLRYLKIAQKGGHQPYGWDRDRND